MSYRMILGITPGKNIKFEKAPFALTHEMVELMSNDIISYKKGVPKDPLFLYFVKLFISGFMVLLHY